MADAASPEKGASLEPAVEQKANLIVSQPKKLEGLLETISLIDKVSERIGEDHSGDLGGGSGTSASGSQQGDAHAQQSIRQLAIANLPEPRIMQKQLEKHIHQQVKKLHKRVHRITRASSAGHAHQINELYAQIRRLNGILAELIETSYEAIKRLYIRVFVDRQNIM